MTDFTTFHDRTRATFIACEAPDRAADYVSESGSEYWDTGEGVIRRSNHWAGQNGCTSMRSCIWQFAADLESGQWATGYCAYADFAIRRTVPVWHEVTGEDVAAARQLDGVAVAASDWTIGTGRRTRKLTVPAWAREAGTGWQPADAKIKRLLKTRPRVQWAILADQRVIRAILGGARKVKIGEKLA